MSIAVAMVFVLTTINPFAISSAKAQEPSDILTSEITTKTESEILDFWTPEKMAAAQPVKIAGEQQDAERRLTEDPSLTDQNIAPEAEPEILSDPVGPTINERPSLFALAAVPRTVGRLFFQTPGGPGTCSASVVNKDDNKNLIMTAGHCVHPGDGSSFYDNFIFIPATYDESEPYHTWTFNKVVTLTSWSSNSNWNHDQAFLQLNKSNGSSIVDLIGGNGLTFNNSRSQENTRVLGYPDRPPFDGKRLYQCDGNTSPLNFLSLDAKIACGMNEGASGGPWLKNYSTHVGYIWAITSRCAEQPGTGLCARTELYATPFDNNIRDLFYGM